MFGWPWFHCEQRERSDSLTIYADKVRLAKKTLQIEANGNVVVEDGKNRTEAKSVKVKFEAGKPTLDLIR